MGYLVVCVASHGSWTLRVLTTLYFTLVKGTVLPQLRWR